VLCIINPSGLIKTFVKPALYFISRFLIEILAKIFGLNLTPAFASSDADGSRIFFEWGSVAPQELPLSPRLE